LIDKTSSIYLYVWKISELGYRSKKEKMWMIKYDRPMTT
jgi:hypothetical protein